MKTKYFFLIGLIFFTAGLISCQKEISFEIPDETIPNVVSSVDSNYLDKILIVDANNFIDSSLWIFNYDAQKRLNNVSIKNTTNPLDSQVYVKLFYNQNDTLPFKAKTFQDSAYYYFFYDSFGRIEKDSLIDYGNGNNNPTPYILVNNYSYNTGKIFITHYSFNGIIPTNIFGVDTLLQDSRGNIINSKLYSSNTPSNFTLQNTIVTTYDNKLNPFMKVRGFKIFIFSEGDFPGSTYENNLVSFNNYDNTQPTNTYTENYFNTYYSNGLLKNSVITGNLNAKWTYYYKSL